mgnify:CR=1 FL=1
MEKIGDFELKNLGGDYFYTYPEHRKPKRSAKGKLFIIFNFIVFLAITPAAIFGLTNINFNKVEKVSIAKDPVFENKKTVNQNTKIFEPESVSVEVLNNDSYYKITKRICGSGKYYLAIQALNNSKPLFKGDLVTVNCSL